MADDHSMDIDQSATTTTTSVDVDRFRLPNESDQQWYYRKQFIEAFRFDYNEERLLCLAQCYANTKCLGCTYSEPLKSLLIQLSDKLSNSSTKRPTSEEFMEINNKRNASINNTTVPMSSLLASPPNFVSFSSSIPSATPNFPAQQIQRPIVDPKSMLCESAETKCARLRTFANHLKQSIEAAQNRTGNDENDHAIEHIYQVGTQQRLFVDYRPDHLSDSSHCHATPTNSFLTQTFHGKLYIDEVYIASGQGTNKKFCKRHCFQQALNHFMSEYIEVKLVMNTTGRQQYELVRQTFQEHQQDVDQDETESFSIPSYHPMANTKMNFVHARDTSTIAGRTARQQNKLEQQYWHQLGRGVPFTVRPRRNQRSFSPPPPVPHQTANQSTTAIIEAAATTQTSVAAVVAEMEQAAQQHEQDDRETKYFVHPLPTRPTDGQIPHSILPMNQIKSAQQPICSEAAKNAIDPVLLTQQRAKLLKMQQFLFSLLNTLADASHSIDLISTQINKYQLHAEFNCADKATINGFHGHLIVEQIEIADGFGINKKLAKRQAYAHALQSISSAKSFSLALRDEIRWILICHQDETGILQAPPPRRPLAVRGSDERPSRWGPPTALSAITPSTTSAVRHFHERRVEEGSQREREYHTANGICIPPPALIEPSLTRADISKDLSRCTSSTDETIVNNIRRLIPNTFVVFELLDFDENIAGHYVSMLFTSISKNKLELKYEFTHVSNGFLVTYTIDNRFFMCWVASTKVAAKQAGAKKAIEMLRTLYPSIKTKHVVDDMSMNDNEVVSVKRRLIARSQLYEQQPFMARTITKTTNTPQKDDMGAKLLKKMGWAGGGIGKDLQGIAEPIQIEDLQGRKGLGSNSLFPDQIFIKNLRRLLEEFIATNTDDGELQFANDFNSEERKSIHKEAMRLHLTSNSYGRDGERRIRITQKRNVDQLVDHLLTHGGETARYELKAQTQPRSTVVAAPQSTSYSQIAPPGSQWTAPDACDDGTL